MRSYAAVRQEFIPANDLVQDGLFHSSADARQYFYKKSLAVDRKTLTEWLVSTLAPYLDASFAHGLTERPVSELFVPPPLIEDGRLHEASDSDTRTIPDETHWSFDEVVASDCNIIFTGPAEYGKTTLLQRLGVAIAAHCPAGDTRHIPVVINFSDLRHGTDGVLRSMRAALPELPSAVRLVSALEEGLVCLLIDDVNIDDQPRYAILKRFIGAYPRNRFIMTAPSRRNDRFLAPADPDLPILFKRIRIHPLRRREVRSLVEKWDNENRGNHDEIIERLLGEFRQMNVPLTAVNGTILLSILQEQSDFSAINRSVLVERFVETLLDKRSPEEVKRKNLDYKIKVDVLASIAEHMARQDRYILDEDDIAGVVRGYFARYGLKQDLASVIKEFIEARILAERPERKLSFRYRSFLEFFIATRMAEEAEFRGWVLEEERYLGFVNEIQYYAAINRKDGALLQLLGLRFEALARNVFAD